MAAGIFISYRHDDTRHVAGRLAGDLADRFGAERIFRDIERIEPGVDFTVALNRALGSCVVMLVMLGERWLTIEDAKGRRRLDDARDWTRLEVATALQRGIRVVPVLVEDTVLPAEDELPEDLKPLVRRQAVRLSDLRWKGDLQNLVETLERVPGLEPARASKAPAPAPAAVAAPAKSGNGKLWAGIAIGIVGLLAVGAMISEGEKPRDDTASGTGAALSPPPAAQVAAPAPMPTAAPAPAPQTPAVPDLGGVWRSADGSETYQFRQSGNQVAIAAFTQGMQIGSGQGIVQGQLLQMNLSLNLQGVNLANMGCNVQASPDLRSLLGVCSGPVGQFPVHFVR